MAEFLRSRAWFAILTVISAVLALESLLTGDTVIGVIFVVGAVVAGWRTVAWERFRRDGE
jgi:hypothetical protein